MSTVLTDRIAELIGPSLEAMGFDLVRVRLSGRDGDRTLQVMAEPSDGGEMNVQHCTELSEAISALLDVEDPVPGRYNLEVSSPGIDRPLVKVADYERFAGFEATVETKQALDGRKKFRGRIAGVNGENIQMECDGGNAALPFDEIRRASLVITDELIEAARREASAAAQTEH